MKTPVKLNVNRQSHELFIPENKTLLEVLREDLGLMGTKHGCELGECGACTVLINGEPHLACLTMPLEVEGKEILTVEGMGTLSKPHPLQTAFVEMGAIQCGYCTSGMLLTSKALLDQKPLPSRAEIKDALSGNICRCTGFRKIYDAVELAAKRMCDQASADRAPTLKGGTSNE
ncbi:(2Fe-2S)-binding protein [Desulfoscipio gibsoniae]|nr:(2Fe-2S)-binding protein [Desulfoscipio gibsoniae]